MTKPGEEGLLFNRGHSRMKRSRCANCGPARAAPCAAPILGAYEGALKAFIIISA